MGVDGQGDETESPVGRQPIFLLPGAVTVLCVALVVIHAITVFALDDVQRLDVTVWLAFIPYRLVDPLAAPGGMLPLLWTPFTHAFLHAGWEHVLFNTVWLAIFATPVVRRYGTTPMILIFLISAAVGAIAFAATTLPALQVLVGASGGVAGLTGAAIRFMFQPVITARDPETGEQVILGRRLATLGELLRSPPARNFTLIWIAINAAVPLLPGLAGGELGQIAWQAHLGGFFAGLLLVPIFEKRQPAEVRAQ